MPVPAMGEAVVDHQRQFQAAVDVIHNLPKNGSYRPSYEVMLRFYSLYKQAVCGRCTAPRPGFWDPVGRYKWDAWSCLGEMSSDSAMAAYVDEMKKVAQEVIDTMPMNEKTASLFHHFEPLYLVIDDMPRPPESLFTLSKVLKGGDDHPPSEEVDPDRLDGDQEPNQTSEGVTENTVPHNTNAIEEPRLSEGLALTSDSETEVFCDSVDSVEQLSSIKASKEIPLVKCNGFHGSRVPSESCQQLDVRQVGAGHGGEGAEDVKNQGPGKRGRESGRDASSHSWREGSVPQGSSRRGAVGGGGGGSGSGRGGGDGSEGGAEQLHDAHLQQQIVLALRRLREDMRSVMDRLEAVERLAATHAQGSEWRQCLQCVATASKQEEQRWWSLDVSPPTLLLFLLWPFAAQGLMFLLRRAHRRTRTPS